MTADAGHGATMTAYSPDFPDSYSDTLAMLRRRLKIEEYEAETPYESGEMQPASVRVLLKQHAGTAASAIVRAGDRVRRGQKIGEVGASELGAAVHASIDGTVRAVTTSAIEISA